MDVEPKPREVKFPGLLPPPYNQTHSPAMVRRLSIKLRAIDLSLLVPLLIVGLLLGLKPAESRAQETITVASSVYCPILNLDSGDCGRVKRVTNRSWFSSDGTSFRTRTSDPLDSSNPIYCLTMDVALPAGSRIDFQWALLSSNASSILRFYINDRLQQTLPDQNYSGDGSFTAVQQFADYPDEVPITSLQWCHHRTQANSFARVDNLNFSLSSEISPSSAPPTRVDYCSALNLAPTIDNSPCDMVESVDPIFPQYPWRSSSFEAVENTGPEIGPNSISLRSATDLPNGGESCVRLNFRSELSPNTQIIFYGWVQSEADNDFLKFYGGEQELYSLTGVYTFRRVQRVILEPTDHLTWCYEKDDNLVASQDIARIDVLSIEAPATAAQSQTTDFPDFCNQWLRFGCSASNAGAVTFTSDYPWMIQSGVLTIGPNLPNNSQSCVSVRVSQLPLWSRIRFRWRAAIHSSDFLGFYINGRLLGQVTNTGSSYRNTSFVADQLEDISNTASILSWCYVTDEASVVSDDFIGLDDVSIDATEFDRTGFNQADYCEQLDATDQCSLFSGMFFSRPPGINGLWERIAADPGTGYPLRSIRSRATTHNQRSCFVLPELNLQADTVIEFQWAVFSDENEDFFRFRTTDGVSESAAAHFSISGQSGTASNRFEQVQFRVIDASQARRASWCVENSPDQNIVADAVGRLAQLKFYSPDEQPVVVDNLSAICTTLGLGAGECGLISRARINARQNPWAHRNVTVDSNPETVLTAPNHSPHTEDEPIYRQSCLTLDVNLPSQTVIGFRWRLTTDSSIDNDSDRFRFLINGASQDSIGPDNSFQFDRFTASGEVSELSWCHQINGDFDAFTKGNAEFFDLSFDIPEQRASDLQAVCAALDIASTDCRGRVGLDLVNNARHTGALPWDISSSQAIDSLRGDNALLNTGDLRGFTESCFTLDTLIRLASGQSLGFFWRLNGSSGDNIRFVAISGGELGRLSGNGEDSGWQVVNVAGSRTIISLQWCYRNPSFSSGEYAVVDRLAIGPTLTIAPRPGGQRQPLDNAGLHRFQVDVNAQQDYGGTIRQAEIELALLSHSSGIEISALTVENWTNTAAQLYALDFTVQFDAQRLLRDGTTSGQADALFNFDIPGFPTTQADGYQIQVANSALLRNLLCQVLDVSTSDCSAITAEAVSNTPDYPWVITSEAERVLSGSQALTLTGRELTGMPQLNYRLEVDVSLPAGTAIQFHRLTDTNSCESLRFAINNFTWLESVSQTFATSEAYMLTRLYAETAVPITRLTWDYRDLNTQGQLCRTIHNDLASPETGASSRVWIDQLSFILPVTTVSQLCSILDVDNDDCALISVVTTFDTPWVEMLNTGANNSLRPHPGVSNNQSSCLVLDVDLPANTRIDFELAYNLPSSGDRFRLYEGLEVENDLVVSAGGMHETHRQQRFFSNPVRTLRWCLDKVDNAAVDAEFVELNHLSFTSGSAARLIPDRQSLCEALDLNSIVCPVVNSFTQNPESLLWRSSTEVTSVRGDSVIGAPATLPGETSCLNLAFSGLQAGLTVSFNWRVDGSTADTLSFSINGNQVQSRQGTGAASRWFSVSQPAASAETVINSLHWCYGAGSGSTTVGQAWIDNLQFGFPASALTATTPIQATDMPNRFSFVVTVTASLEDGNLPESPQFDLEPQALGVSSISYVATAQSSPGTGLFRRAFAVTAYIELNALVESGMLRLSQPSSPLTGNPQSEVVFDDLAGLRQITFCRALALSEQDCNRLTAVGSTADYPWEIGNAVSGSERQTLRSGGSNNAAVNSCLQLELALAAGSRIDFLWALSAGTGDRFRFLANNLSVVDLMAQADAPTEEWQQRLSATAINSLSWCYSHSSGSSIRGLFRQLSFQPPAQAALIASKEALCAALDTGDCEQISSFTQQHADSTTLQLSWAVTDAQSVAGGSSLRTPLTVPTNGESCLNLAVDLPVTAQFRFSWQVDSAATDFLRFRLNDTVISSISGSLADNPWREIIHTLTSPAEEISWCFDDTAGASAGQSLGWIDQLRFRSAATQIAILMSTGPKPSQPLQGEYVLSVTIGDFDGFQPLPEGIQLTATEMENIASLEVSDTLNGLNRIYTFDVNLQNPYLPAQLTLALGGVDTRLLRPDQKTLTVQIPGSVSSILCPPLDISAEDCGRISSISSAGAWELTTATFQTGSNLFTSASELPNSDASCLILAVNLPAASRIDFNWAVDSETGDQLQFAVNGETVAAIDGLLSTAPHERQQRFSAAAVTELSWCYRKNTAGMAGADRGWLDNLAFFVNTQALLLPNREALCMALDLGGNDCDPISSFSQTHSPNSIASLSWAVTSEQSINGGSSLRSPLTVPETGESCLVFSTELPDHTRIRFYWQVDSAAADFLRFRVDDTVIASISGGLADNPWREINHLQETVFDSISWCFDDTAAASANMSTGWIDQLQLIPLPQFAIVMVSSATALPTLSLGHYRFDVIAEDGNDGLNVVSSLQQLSLSITGQNNIVSSIITSATTEENSKRFTVTLQLQTIDTSGELTLVLNHSDTNLLATTGISRRLLLTAPTAAEILCPALDLDDEDCTLINGFATTTEYPWRVTTTVFQVGENLLTSARTVPFDDESCLRLTLNLETGSRIDFSWSIDSLSGNTLQFSFNNLPPIGIEGILPVHRQQRFSNAAVSTLSWCYSEDSSSEPEQDRGWLDQLNFLSPDAAELLGNKQALCTALDLSIADCAAISTFSQTPDSLSWGVVTDIELDLPPNGTSALSSPLTVTADESACLTLQTALPAGTVLNFNWQIDAASSSMLNLQINGAPAAGISISGPTTERTIDSWQTQSHTSAAALNSLGWCYRRSAGFAGLEQGWLDQLSLEPPFIYPQIILATTPTRIAETDDEIWQFLMTVRRAADAPGTPALPAGLQLVVTSKSNISTFTITAVENSDSTMSNHRITVTLEAADNIGIIRFGLSSLPAAVEPMGEGLSVTIEPRAVAQATPILARLADDPDGEEMISLPDLLLGLRIVNEVNTANLNANLQSTNSNFATDMEAFTALLKNLELNGAIDIDGNSTVDTLDFRLMLRYRAGLRGASLCDEFCLIRLQLLLGN